MRTDDGMEKAGELLKKAEEDGRWRQAPRESGTAAAEVLQNEQSPVSPSTLVSSGVSHQTLGATRMLTYFHGNVQAVFCWTQCCQECVCVCRGEPPEFSEEVP